MPQTASQKSWYEKNREDVRASQAKYYRDNKMAFFERRLKGRYGIDLVSYNALLEKQGGGCAICGGPPNGRSADAFHVDHDHATGKVRGLLCHHCNTAIGSLRDDVSLIEKAAAYLRLHKE